MLRILGILVPALVGAALVWFLIPTSGGARDDASLASKNRLSDDDKKVLSVGISALLRDPEDLFGKPLQIVTPDNQFTLEDLQNGDAKFLSRAYQECQLVLDRDLYRRYLESIGEAADDEAAQSDESQTAACVYVIHTMKDLLASES